MATIPSVLVTRVVLHSLDLFVVHMIFVLHYCVTLMRSLSLGEMASIFLIRDWDCWYKSWCCVRAQCSLTIPKKIKDNKMSEVFSGETLDPFKNFAFSPLFPNNLIL